MSPTKLCGRCAKKVWPYLIGVFMSVFVAFLTWLTLASVGMPSHVIFGWSFAAFIAALTLLLVYIVTCVRRHCSHQ